MIKYLLNNLKRQNFPRWATWEKFRPRPVPFRLSYKKGVIEKIRDNKIKFRSNIYSSLITSTTFSSDTLSICLTPVTRRHLLTPSNLIN